MNHIILPLFYLIEIQTGPGRLETYTGKHFYTYHNYSLDDGLCPDHITMCHSFGDGETLELYLYRIEYGQDIEEYLKKSDNLQDTLDILTEKVLYEVKQIVSSGINHLDITYDNIIVDDEDNVWILGFSRSVLIDYHEYTNEHVIKWNMDNIKIIIFPVKGEILQDLQTYTI